MSGLSPADRRWLDSAARYAAAQPGTGGNPAAALVVDETEGLVLGRGVAANGSARPEVDALAEAGAAARGRTLYTTTDPRPQPVIDAGIGRVVVGDSDPSAARHEARVTTLRGAGIEVIGGDHAPSVRLLEGRAARAARGRPLVTIRLAISSDGAVARRDGKHSELMGQEARRWALLQRSLHGAIVVGGRTAGLDATRLDECLDGLDSKAYARVVVIGSTTLPPRHYLERSVAVRETQAVVLEGRGPALPTGVEVIAVPGRNGRPDLRRMLTCPEWPFASVLVEPGPKLTEAMLSTEMVDRLHLIECAAEIGPDGLPATPLGGLAGRLRAAGLVEIASEALGVDRLRTFEPAR